MTVIIHEGWRRKVSRPTAAPSRVPVCSQHLSPSSAPALRIRQLGTTDCTIKVGLRNPKALSWLPRGPTRFVDVDRAIVIDHQITAPLRISMATTWRHLPLTGWRRTQDCVHWREANFFGKKKHFRHSHCMNPNFGRPLTYL